MTKTVLSAVALAAFAMIGGAPVHADEMTKGEAKLAKLIEGRVAGEPKSCIRDYPVRSFQVIDKTAIVYKIGRTVWVNYTRDPESLDDRDALVFRKFGSSVCKSDIVTTIDPVGGFYTGNVFLSDFIPYNLPDKGA